MLGHSISGEIYSALFQSASEGASNYVQIDTGNSPVRVVKDKKTALELWTSTNFGLIGTGGAIQFYDTVANAPRGNIMTINNPLGNGLRVGAEDENSNKRDLVLDGYVTRINSEYVLVQDAVTSWTNMMVVGDLHVTGDLSANGAKPAIQPTENYGERYQFARESPDVRYVIEGYAQFVDGKCRIDLDPIFLECIEPIADKTPWTFWFTPLFEYMNIKVAEIGDSYFVVKEKNGGNGQFCWKLSAIRQGYAGTWMPEKVDLTDELLTSNWEDELLEDAVFEIDETVLTSNWEDELL